MTGRCKRDGCPYGYKDCCIVCEEREYCGIPCDDVDRYDFSEECSDYEVIHYDV